MKTKTKISVSGESVVIGTPGVYVSSMSDSAWEEYTRVVLSLGREGVTMAGSTRILPSLQYVGDIKIDFSIESDELNLYVSKPDPDGNIEVTLLTPLVSASQIIYPNGKYIETSSTEGGIPGIGYLGKAIEDIGIKEIPEQPISFYVRDSDKPEFTIDTPEFVEVIRQYFPNLDIPEGSWVKVDLESLEYSIGSENSITSTRALLDDEMYIICHILYELDLFGPRTVYINLPKYYSNEFQRIVSRQLARSLTPLVKLGYTIHI